MTALIKAVILIMATMFWVEGVVITVAQVAYHDPFASYLAVMPGQSIDALVGYPCRFISAKTTDRQIGTCEFPADWGPFGQIMLTAYGHIIRSYFKIGGSS